MDLVGQNQKTNFKSQIPSTKFQTPKPKQIPNSKFQKVKSQAPNFKKTKNQ